MFQAVVWSAGLGDNTPELAAGEARHWETLTKVPESPKGFWHGPFLFIYTVLNKLIALMATETGCRSFLPDCPLATFDFISLGLQSIKQTHLAF
ncbi:hypothetical protein AVEN_6776-1 [Araneus ventricosus]|uniref:Uncharacterized protein n=1 Tax=Araneus ventricosus TaxID=182803 RepID=A0A4Y2TRC7_ARAVE|nr:hypothetical protein AVEN_6776-1 [Araneus ventricosus]